MYSFTTDGNYKIEKILSFKQLPNQTNYYSNLNQDKKNNPYKFQFLIHDRSEQHLYPIYKMNSERYFPNESLIDCYKNNYNNYSRNAHYLNKRSYLIRNNNLKNTTAQDEKFYYNDRVIIHKRNINSIKNYKNNSIHFVRTCSNKKNDIKEQNKNTNRNIAYMNNNKDRKANEIINSNDNKNISNNYNIIKFEKNSRFDRNKSKDIKIIKNIYINNNLNRNLNNYNAEYGFNPNIIKINDRTNYTIEKYIINKDFANKGKNYIIDNQNMNKNINDVKCNGNSKINDEIEKLNKEKENLQKRLNEVMNENEVLKNINLNNKHLAIKNKTLTEKLNEIENKVKKLEKEKENYINEIDNNKNIKTTSDNEIKNICDKLKNIYLKLIMKKRMMQNKKKLKKYFLKLHDITNKIRQIEIDGKNYKNFVNEISTSIKNNNIYKNIEEEKKEKENLIKKRNKKLKELVNNKIRDHNSLIHSVFLNFYYKGLINEIQNQHNNIIKSEPQKVQDNYNIQEQKQVEQPLNIEEQPQIMHSPLSEQLEIKESKREEEKKREEPPMTEEELKKKEEEKKRINKQNQNRRRKLKKLLEDEKKQKLQIKRLYFQRFHFRAYFFSHQHEDTMNDYLTENIETRKTEEMKKREKEERERQKKKEREELMEKRAHKLKGIIYKTDRRITIYKKNIIEKWNLRTKLIGLKEIKEKDKESKKGKSRKKSKKNKKDNA